MEDENGNPISPNELGEEEQSEDNRAEMYDEINSLYNMENPKGEPEDDRKSQYSQ